jgi:ABC-type enterobactin transport system permease subunit
LLFDQVTDTEMRAARLLGGATMAAFLAARLLGKRARAFRMVIAGIYITAVLGVAVYYLL